MFNDSEQNSFSRSLERGVLNIVVHTASFENEILAQDATVDKLLQLGCVGGIRLVCTPTENPEVARTLRQKRRVDLATVTELGEWIEISTAGFIAPFREHSKRLAAWRDPAEPESNVSILDELFTRPYEVDMFVAAPNEPFLARDPSHRHYVTPNEAFELVRLLLVGFDSYWFTANHRITETLYLDYRRNKMIPAFNRAEVIMRNVRDKHIADLLAEQIESLKKRVELILRAADQIGIHALMRPTGESPGKCGYHLAYFIMLVTGLFDELAWSAAYDAHLEGELRHVDLRKLRNNKGFHTKLAAVNPDLANFLSDPHTCDTLALFYPARNQMQHRTVLSARLLSPNHPLSVVWELPDETLRVIEALSANAGTSWGMINGRSAGFVDPHLFALSATKAVTSLADGVLKRIDWDKYLVQLDSDLQDGIQRTFASRVGNPPRHQFLKEEPLYL